MARQGGNDNAMTSYDSTAYFQMIAKDRLELVMAMEADRMVNLDLADEHVYPERDVILEERRSRVDNEPSALLGEQLMAAQYLHHPYRLPVIGWFHEIAGYTREDALEFYRDWYAPNNAVLVVAGDVTAAELRPLAEKTYGRSPPARCRHAAVWPSRRSMPSAGSSCTTSGCASRALMRSYLAPSYASPGHEHAYALELLAEILGGGGTSRLFRAVVVEQGAGGRRRRLLPRHRPRWRRPSASMPARAPGVDMAELEGAMRREIAEVLADGVTEQRARAHPPAPARRSRSMPAIRWAVPRACSASALTCGEAVGDVEAWPARIAAVTARAGARRRPPRVPARAVGDRAPAAGRRAPPDAGRPAGGRAHAALQSTAEVEEVVSACGVRAYLMREPTHPVPVAVPARSWRRRRRPRGQGGLGLHGRRPARRGCRPL